MLQIAKVLKSNGTEGDILIGFLGIEIGEIDLTEPVYIEFDGLPVPFFFEKLEPKGSNKGIAHITGVNSLKDSEEIVGRSVYADYFEEEEAEDDFLGWTVYDKDKLVGTVDGLEDIPGNPCISIGKVLIPLHEDFIIKTDEKKRILVLNLPAGLI